MTIRVDSGGTNPSKAELEAVKAENATLDTDSSFAANSDVRVPSQKAVKTATDRLFSPEHRLLMPTIPTFKNTAESATEEKQVFSERVPRWISQTSLTLTSGSPVFLGHAVPAGQVINGVGVSVITTEVVAANRTHLWVALLNSSREVVARSADYTSGTNSPLESSTVRAMKFTEPYTVGSSATIVYAVLCEVLSAGTCAIINSREATTFLQAVVPPVGGTGPGSQTTPGEFKGTITLTGGSKAPWLPLI